MKTKAYGRALTRWVVLVLAVGGCADDPADDSAARGNNDDAAGHWGGSAPLGGSPSAGAGGSGGSASAFIESWRIDSDLMINGHAAQDEVESAAAIHQVIDGDDYLSVVLTDVESYCEAKLAGDCAGGPHFALVFSLNGALEPGTYDVADGIAGGLMGDVSSACLSGGIGADSGTITVSKIELGAGGGVELHFDLTFLSGHAAGSVVAPLCSEV